MTDPIADMLARIRNATMARHTRVDMPLSRLKVEIAKILESEGYIQGFKVVEPKDGEPQAHAPRAARSTGRAASASSPASSASAVRAAASTSAATTCPTCSPASAAAS